MFSWIYLCSWSYLASYMHLLCVNMVSSSECFEWLDLAHVHTCSWFKTNIASMIFMFMVSISYSSSIQCWLFIMHDYDRFCSLASRFSTYLLAFTCTKREYCLCIKILKPKSFQMSPLYLPICGIVGKHSRKQKKSPYDHPGTIWRCINSLDHDRYRLWSAAEVDKSV